MKNYNLTKLNDILQVNITNEILDINKYKYLQSIECRFWRLKKIINMCKYVSYLDCRDNCITELDNLPDFLNTLYCSSNKLICLDNLPEKLVKLICSYNNITSLNNLPTKLKYLDCSNCDLIDLKNLPIGLKELICDSSRISFLDYLPETIISLTICMNDKTGDDFSLDLDNLPKSIDVISINKLLLPKISMNKNIWYIEKKLFDDVKLKKKVNINNDEIIFREHIPNLKKSEINCENCGIIIVNCKCYHGYLHYDFEVMY